jgi:N,N-dimethylformamidase
VQRFSAWVLIRGVLSGLSDACESNRDLYLNHFLATTLGMDGYHVLTDHELHARGREALDGYRVVLFPSHPEYWTADMRTALQEWLEDGGRGMCLGGNGF